LGDTVESRDPGSHDDGNTGDCTPQTLGVTDSRPLSLSVSYPVAGVCVVAAAGELDMMTARLLDDYVREQLAAGPVQLVIDLDEVVFLGSAGLTALLRCSRQLQETVPGSKLHLTGTTRREIHRPLELVGLMPLFNVHRTLDEVLARITTDVGDAAKR
jgi:anti-sigma B factor antagonist